MYRKKSQEERDIEKYVLADQMIHRGILSKEEQKERKDKMQQIAEKYDNFMDDEGCKAKRYSVSLGLVRRRNAMYHSLLEQILGDNAAKLERYIYYCMEHNIEPNECILSAQYNADYEED